MKNMEIDFSKKTIKINGATVVVLLFLVVVS